MIVSADCSALKDDLTGVAGAVRARARLLAGEGGRGEAEVQQRSPGPPSHRSPHPQAVVGAAHCLHLHIRGGLGGAGSLCGGVGGL